MSWLTIVGIALQLLGTLVAALGLSRTWREWAPPDERFFDPLADFVSAVGLRVSGAIERARGWYERMFRGIARLKVEDAIHFDDEASLVDSRSGAPISPATIVILTADELAMLLAGHTQAGADVAFGIGGKLLQSLRHSRPSLMTGNEQRQDAAGGSRESDGGSGPRPTFLAASGSPPRRSAPRR